MNCKNELIIVNFLFQFFTTVFCCQLYFFLVEVELSDEQGNLKHICHAGEAYANLLLNVERESLILLQIKRIQSNKKCSDKKDAFSKNSDNIIYTPLLKNEKIITSKFTGTSTILISFAN